MDGSVSVLTKVMWSTACSAWRWAAAVNGISTCPPQYPDLVYGYLQGTLGRLYGGSLVQPRRLRSTLMLNDAQPMFSLIGTRVAISDWLRTMSTMVFSKAILRPSSDILIELYRSPARLSLVDEYCKRRAGKNFFGRLALLAACCWHRLGCVFSTERQLVIRPASSLGEDVVPPVLSILVPQGIMLSEVAPLLEQVESGSLDVTRDKALNIRVIGRSRAAELIDFDYSDDEDPAFLLPPYQPYQSDLPPAYSLCA
ncbi:hypothetical protein COEREDRAFT_83609 [Coemansia reversa NRRL 1564]|uniref:Uncharacterized protein n=1 Tax=Coemansia reversa (strain ATCC 12441 / NRRL 1564) TaxID=763665 RepID=A0A2G5B2N4_COERN|nr:hypothetical protein COEREDRAFT_83609 [Coemansia reversa NRRL 1564]|eukprot:PIA13266.1 hypothetical protein COEREDRAFT_83609 [Coemansia reversa NRRL 1564]